MKLFINIILAFGIIINTTKAQNTNFECLPDTINILQYAPDTMIREVLLPLPPPVTPPYYDPLDSFRMVYWVHGMNGFSGSWDKAATASSVLPSSGPIPGFKPRKILSYQPDYSNNQHDLSTAAIALRPQLIKDSALPSSYRDSSSFIIAHSQGGIVTREMLYLDDQSSYPHKIGGFVTFGSVHRGAVGLTGSNRALSYQFFERAAIDLSEGFLTEYEVNYVRPIEEFNSKFIGKILNLNFSLPDKASIQARIKDLFLYDSLTNKYGFLLNMIRGKVASEIAQEMQIGSYALNTLNSYDPKMKGSVAFYGVKEPFTHTYSDGRTPLLVDPIWSLLHYAVNNPNDDPYFEADNDWKMAEKVRNAQLDYIETIHKYDPAIDLLQGFWCIPDILCNCPPPIMDRFSEMEVAKHFSPKVCRKNNRHKKIWEMREIQAAYQVGSDWFSKANSMWEVAMGALKEETVRNTCECTIKNLNTGEEKQFLYYPIDRQIPCGTNIQYNLSPEPDWHVWEQTNVWQENLKKVVTRKEYDGVALAESARDLPFSTHNMKLPDGTYLARLSGSSHMQMRNDNNLRIALNHLYDGHVGKFFETKLLIP